MRTNRTDASLPLQTELCRSFRGLQIHWERVIRGALLVLAACHVLTTERVERPGYDSSMYIVGARSLAWKGSYEMDGIRITTHPPGLPLLLAIPVRLTGDSSHEFLVHFIPLFGIAGLLIWLRVLAKAAGLRPAAAVILVVAVSPVYYHLATRYVMADLPYLLFSGMALHACYRMAAAGTLAAGWAWCAWGVSAVSLAVLTRSAGVALAAGLLAWSLWPGMLQTGGRPPLRVRLWCALASLAGLAVFGGWIAWAKAMENREEMGGHMASYSSQFMLKDPQQPDLGPASPADLAARVAKFAPLRAAQTAEILTGLPWVSSKWYNPLALGLLLLPLAAFGSARREPFLMLAWWYFAAFLGLFCLWPFAETARFMAPIAPPHLLLSWIGARRLLTAARRARAGWIATLLLSIGAGALWSEARSPAPRGMQDWISLFFWPAAAAAWLLFRKAASSPRAASAMSAARNIFAPASLSILIVAGLAG